jgi:hypothetical protein
VDLDAGQRLVVEHEHEHGAGPLRVLGGFGSGISTALEARAERLRAEGRRSLLLSHSRSQLVDLAVEILRRRGGRRVELVPSPSVLAALVSRVAPEGVDRHEAAATVVAFQASFLGDEELRVHADAAGCLAAAEGVIATTARHRAVLAGSGLVDHGGAVVEASLLLRDPEVLAAEQARFDELLVDDFQLASFATNRLLSQLAGPGGPLVVGGNPEAAVSRDPLASAAHLDRVERRFGGTTVTLDGQHRTAVRPPELRLVGEEGIGTSFRWTGPDDLWITAAELESFVGREGRLVVVDDVSATAWPAPRPVPTWFYPELFNGPDVPADDERERRWLALERRRVEVATTRATQATVLLAQPPITAFVGELLR